MALAALGLAACSGPPSNSEVQSATFHLNLHSCTGGITNGATAFLVEDLGAGTQLVSVAHAFEDIKSFDLKNSDGLSLNATLIYLDAERDLAVLELDDPEPEQDQILGLEMGDPDDDTTVRYVTFADSDGPGMSEAIILRYTRLTLDGVGNRAGIELRAPIEAGDSGSPLISDQGEVLGMVFATSKGSDRGWAIAAEEILLALDRAAGSQSSALPLTCDP